MAPRAGNQGSIVVAGKTYRVLRFAIHEQLSQVSSLVCSLERDDDPPDPATLIDQPAVFTLLNNDGVEKRTFVGSVVRVARAEELVDLVVQPKAWRMTRRADCRIFQQMSVVDIVTKVLSEAGVDTSSWKTTGSYTPRDYTVQYRETDLAFITRLLSEEGIYFSIQHADVDTIVFGDNPTGLGPISPASLTYRPSFGEGEAGVQALVTDVSRAQQVRSDKTTLRDYNPDKPKVKLESTAKTGKAEAEVYVWPGRFTDPKVGDRYAQILLDSLRADTDVVTGRAGVLSMVPGMTFSIEGHPYAPLNQEYMLVSVDYDGQDDRDFDRGFDRGLHQQQSSGGCTFGAIPTKTVAYRPPRQVREHFVAGAQTAFTTGPSGQEIYTDAGGHVKAQFHWDRLGTNDEKSSTWMRTSQLPTGGSMLLPRMKWEVTVRYLEGDVDRPFVMARMTNTATPPPYTLPAHKAKSSIQTATSPGGGSTNETRMSDEAGSEEMMMNASKDMSIDVNNNTTEGIGNNLTRQVGANHTLSITNSLTASVGANQTVSVSGNQDIHVSTFMVDQVTGNHTLAISGARTVKIGGDHKREIAGDSTLEVDSMMIDLVVGTVDEHGLADYKHTVGAALVEMTAGGRSITVGGNRSETAYLAKIIYTAAGRSVDVTGTMNQKVAGLVYRKTDADLAETSAGNFTEIATGAEILKSGKTIAIEGQSMVTLVMGASIISMTPQMVTVVGASIKVDGQVLDGGALILDN